MTRPAALLLLALAASAPLAPTARAQDEDRPVIRQSEPRVYVAAGVGPGVGLVASLSLPTLGVFTREATLYADARPSLLGGSGQLVTAVGVGGSVQVSQALRTIQRRPPGRFDVAVGARVGPSFTSTPFEPSTSGGARAFEVTLDPFVRVVTRTRGGRVAFAELGGQAPALRAGLALGLPSATRRPSQSQ